MHRDRLCNVGNIYCFQLNCKKTDLSMNDNQIVTKPLIGQLKSKEASSVSMAIDKRIQIN